MVPRPLRVEIWAARGKAHAATNASRRAVLSVAEQEGITPSLFWRLEGGDDFPNANDSEALTRAINGATGIVNRQKRYTSALNALRNKEVKDE